MRAFSRDAKSSYYKYQSLPRNLTVEKRMQQLHTLKENEVKVGIYKYSTDDDLGKGFSSKVYKGVQIEKPHKRYAIKVIELKKFRGSNLEMLEAEIEIHRNLVHQNIVRLYQVIKTPYYYYIIMEYCPHGNLHQYIKQKKKLSEINAIDIMQQVLAGSRYLMEQGVIHRDMKPANILRIGNKWKISDFGFSVKSKYGFKDRINVGTALYMSPESLKKSYYSAKTDIFSLGIILYEMIEGKTPWQCHNQKQLREKLKEQLVIPETIQNEKIKQFIVRCCQLNQNKRMSREELLEFQLGTKDQNKVSAQGSEGKESLISSSMSRAAASASKRPSTLSDRLGPQEHNFTTELEFLCRQFFLAKHLYSCIKNIDSFLISNEQKQNFTLFLFKFLLKLVRFLSDKSKNTFKLNHWQQLTSSKAYKQLYEIISDNSQIYEKEYLEQIKQYDIKNIRKINKKFPDLCHNNLLPEKFYYSLQDYLMRIIRQHNHEVMLLVISYDSKDQVTQNNKEEKKQPITAKISSKSKIQDPPQQTLTHSQNASENKISKNQFPLSQQVQITPLLSEPKKESRLLIKKISKRESKMSQSKAEDNKNSRAESQKKENKNQEKTNITIKDKFQALQGLYTIYRITEARCVGEDEKDSTIEKIRVVENFQESLLEKRDYLDLRRLLRGI